VTNYNHSDTGQQNITSYICLMRMSETSWNQYLSGLEVTHKEIREDLNGGGGGRRGDGGAGVEAHGRGGVEADAVGEVTMVQAWRHTVGEAWRQMRSTVGESWRRTR
jgi:hypothetical protein